MSLDMYGSQNSTHSLLPIVLVVYNLPLRLCMKCMYMMMSLLISSRSRQLRNDIDVYLASLINEFKLLWNEGALILMLIQVHISHYEQ